MLVDWSTLKAVWEEELGGLFSALPIVLDEDESKEKERNACLEKIRKSIASRFMEIEDARAMDKEKRDALFEGFETHVARLKEIHGRDLEFAPWPALSPQCLKLETTDDNVPAKRKGSNASLKSTSSTEKSDIAPHEFFYLCKDSAVWTVVQVGVLKGKAVFLYIYIIKYILEWTKHLFHIESL